MSLFFSALPYKIHRVYIPILTLLVGLTTASVAWAQAGAPAAPA